MKKVLILAYDFPPLVSVGALRPYSWFRHFKEFGIYPIVVTRQWQNKHGNKLDYIAPGVSDQVIYEDTDFGLLVKTPYYPNLANKLLIKYGESKFVFLRKFISFFFEVFQFIFNIGPKVPILFAVRDFLKKQRVDLILATGEPYVLFHYASKLSEEYKIPWVADYRDPWSQDKSRNVFFFSGFLNRLFERRSLKNVSLVVTVSEFFQEKIAILIKEKTIEIISNGFEGEAVNEAQKVLQSKEELNIGFTGTIYPWHPIETFLKVCNQFVINKSPKFRINFYGINIEKEIREIIGQKFSRLENHVSFFPRMENKYLLMTLAKNNLLLLFNYYSFMGTKIYDYIGLRRKILFCFSDDPEANLLKSKSYNYEEDNTSNNLQISLLDYTKAGIIVKDALQLNLVLEEQYLNFCDKGFLACNSENIDEFSRKTQVEKLSGILNQLDKNGHCN